MAGYLYAGESDGGRIVRFGSGLTQITTASTASVLLDCQTWDLMPMGPSGDCVFRSIVVVIGYSNGYSIRVTPYVDGTALEAQTFSGSGAADATDCQAWVKARGARVSVKVEQLTRTGTLSLVDVRVAYVPMRQVP